MASERGVGLLLNGVLRSLDLHLLYLKDNGRCSYTSQCYIPVHSSRLP